MTGGTQRHFRTVAVSRPWRGLEGSAAPGLPGQDKDNRSSAAEVLHICDDIFGARVADFEFPLPQRVADIQRTRRIGYVDIETMPRKYSLLPAGVHRQIIAGPELDQSNFCETAHKNLLRTEHRIDRLDGGRMLGFSCAAES